MKITGATTTLFTSTPARGKSSPPVSGCIIELHTDQGLKGISIGTSDLREQVASLCRHYLEGENPRAAPALWQRMLERHARSGHRGRIRAAMALLDVALWDLKAKANGEPLWKTLGGSRPRVNTVASGAATDDAQLNKWLDDLANEFGVRSAMLQPGPDHDSDLRRLTRARKALAGGGEPELAIDATTSWTPGDTIRRMQAMEKHFDLAWVALRANRRNAARLKNVSDSIRAAVCAGRGLFFPGDFRPYFQRRAIDIVQIDIAVNGVTGALGLADAAFGYELPVMLCAAPGNIQAQLAGAMPYAMNTEVTAPLPAGGIFTSDVRIEHGCAVAGDAPGNGIAIDPAGLTQAAVNALPAAGRRKTA